MLLQENTTSISSLFDEPKRFNWFPRGLRVHSGISSQIICTIKHLIRVKTNNNQHSPKRGLTSLSFQNFRKDHQSRNKTESPTFARMSCRSWILSIVTLWRFKSSHLVYWLNLLEIRLNYRQQHETSSIWLLEVMLLWMPSILISRIIRTWQRSNKDWLIKIICQNRRTACLRMNLTKTVHIVQRTDHLRWTSVIDRQQKFNSKIFETKYWTVRIEFKKWVTLHPVLLTLLAIRNKQSRDHQAQDLKDHSPLILKWNRIKISHL